MARTNKTALIVDDEKTLLHTFSAALTAYAPDLEIVTAENGLKALEILKTGRVDFVVTDLRMPEMDGFQLLIHMKKSYPGIPLLVMTAAGSPEVGDRLKRLGTLSYLEKPVNIKDLALKIFQGISAASEGKIFGVTLAGFLQLIVMERKSCALKVRSGDKSGILLIKEGELVDARTEELSGEAAACDIVTWEDPEIRMGNYTGERQKNIDTALSEILLDAFRMKDERDKAARREGKPSGGASRDARGEEAEAPPKEAEAPPKETEAPTKEAEAPPKEAEAPPKETEAPPKETEAPTKETEAPTESGPATGISAPDGPAATLHDLLSDLAKPNGVYSVCLVGGDGFLIDSVSKTKIEAELVGAIASSGFGASESVGRELGRGELEVIMLEFEQGPIIIVPIGKDFLLAIVADRQAPLGVLRLKIRRLAPEIEAAADAV